jgi:tetratricopeptide (TPR) repeat protein
MECPRLTCLLRCSLAFALLAGGLQGADPVMEAYNRAWALSEQTTTRGQAIDQLKAIIETNPRLWRAYETLVHTYVLAGQVGQGEAYFRKLIARDQTNAYTHFGLGILLKGAQRYREAVEELTLCLRKDPKMFVCYSTLPEAMNMLLKRPASRGASRQGSAVFRRARGLCWTPTGAPFDANMGELDTRVRDVS